MSKVLARRRCQKEAIQVSMLVQVICYLSSFKYAKPAAGGAISGQSTAYLVRIVLYSGHILEVHDTGVRVFDDR